MRWINVAETGIILAKAATVDRWLKGDDAQALVWAQVLGDFTFAEVDGALIEHLKHAERVTPHDLAKIIRHRRQQYTMSNPGWRGAFGGTIDWDDTTKTYRPTAPTPEIEG